MSSIAIPVKNGKIGDESDLRGKIKEIIEANRNLKGALIRILQSAQGLYGYLPSQVLTIISEEMKVPLSEVSGIVSFYSFFSIIPKGDHVIQVCLGTSCYVKGGQRILETLKKDYGLEPGGTTSDNKFSLETVRCLGCCGLSPVVAVGEDIHRRVKPGKIKNILSSYK
jgi:NADH:ubiquinone oxidoreductase subunit E